jgi:putative acetyltransferase
MRACQMTGVALRHTGAGDGDALRALYPRAFPDEDLLPLLAGLLDGPWPVISLAAVIEGGLCGHIAFTLCVDGPDALPQAALLAPLAIAPEVQRQGLGTRLIREGLSHLRGLGIRQVFVLGDPGYYRRFGFVPERRVMPPYPLPPAVAGAWQSLLLGEALPLSPGPLVLPEVWMRRDLWLP